MGIHFSYPFWPIDEETFSQSSDTNLTLRLRNVKGDNDKSLCLPFRLKVTYALIDQQKDVNDRENIVQSCITDFKGEYASYRIASGPNSALVVSQEKLSERRYIVNDTIFVQVELALPQ